MELVGVGVDGGDGRNSSISCSSGDNSGGQVVVVVLAVVSVLRVVSCSSVLVVVQW